MDTYPDPNAGTAPVVIAGTASYRAALKERTVLLEMHCAGVLRGWGTAVLLEDQRAVTAHHVTVPPSTVPEEDRPSCGLVATDAAGNLSPATVSATDVDWDQAFVELPHLPARGLRTAVRKPRWGERVACVGYSFQPIKRSTRMMSMTHGTVATTPAEGMPDGYYRTTAPLLPGHSGGGCWGSDGALLLLIQAGHFQYEGYLYGRPLR